MFQTPILVIAYHRVESTHDLFMALREVQPEKLYIAADGALSNDRTDYQHCLEARCVFMPEWKCEMKTLFMETHQGKSKMFVQAIQWFFEQEEEGIVLFDDTVPTVDFFHFCKQMLEMYRTDRRIGHISGSYLLKHNRLDEGSYYFSAYPLMWGFATWRDRFENFDLKMKELENVEFRTLTDKYQMKQKHANFWNRRYKILQKNAVLKSIELQVKNTPIKKMRPTTSVADRTLDFLLLFQFHHQQLCFGEGGEFLRCS